MNKKIITSQLKNINDKFNNNHNNIVLQNILYSTCISDVSKPVSYIENIKKKHRANFKYCITPTLPILNQQNTGNCWIFSSLNLLRYHFANKKKINTDFEFSTSYIAFYDKLEKANNCLNYFMDKSHDSLLDHEAMNYLMTGVDDGGNWHMCIELIDKYGIVPKENFIDYLHSSNTKYMTEIINSRLRNAVNDILSISKKNYKQRLIEKNDAVNDIYAILRKMMGNPPLPYATLNHDNKKFTPISYIKLLGGFKFSNYLSLGNDPRYKYYKHYIKNDHKRDFFNIPMEQISEYCLKSIKNNSPIYFTCDIQKSFDECNNILDLESCNYDYLFGNKINQHIKENSLNFCHSYQNHAMNIIGADGKNNKATRWKVENSWGYHESSKYISMTDEWFQLYGYNVVINKKYVPPNITKQYLKKK